jgi:hypothetical protein
MAITVRRYSIGGNTSTSAPALTGQVGTLIAVLDYCLTDATYGVGWTKVYSATNQAAYRSPAGTNQFYLFVDDTSTTNATMRAYESMTSISAGTGAFPTTAQRANALYFYKSTSADTTARSWYFISNGKIFYLVAPNTGGMIFGDFVSYKASDAYNTVLLGNATSSASSTSIAMASTNATVSTAGGSCYIPRAYTQLGSSLASNIVGDYTKSAGASYYGNGGAAYPDPITGGLLLSPMWVSEPSAAAVRGILPGFWAPLHSTSPFATGDTYTGSNDLAGKTFEVIPCGSNAVFHFETSDTWVT